MPSLTRLAGVAFMAALSLETPSSAIDWVNPGSSSWGTPANWSPATVPNSVGAVADFTKVDFTSSRTISLDNLSRTVGSILIGDMTNLTGDTTIYSATITMDVVSETALIQVINRNATVRTNLALNDSTVLDVASGSTLTLSSQNSTGTALTTITGAGGLVKNGPGTLVMNGANSFAGGFTLNAGTVRASTNTSLGAATGLLTINGGVLSSSSLNDRAFTFSTLALNASTQFGEASTGSLTFTAASTSLSGTIALTTLQNTTINSNVTGAGAALTKLGSGVLQINGDTSYDGPTLVNAGTLIVNGNMNPAGSVSVAASSTFANAGTMGALTVAGSGTYHIGAGTATASVASVTATSLDLQAASTAVFGLGSNLLAGNDRLTVSGSAITSGNIQVRFFSAPTSGTYNLITAGSLAGSSTLAAMPVGTRSTFALNSTATTLDLIVSGPSAKVLTWSGTASSEWSLASIAGAKNWNDQVPAAEDFFNLDSVVFNDSLTANANVSLSEALQPASVKVTSSSTDYTFSGAGSITGNTSLLKSGTSLLTLSTANSFTGGTTVSQGTVLTTTGTGAGSGPVTLGDAGTGAADVAFLASNASVANPITITTSGTGTATVGSALAATNSAVTTFSGPITMQRATTLQGGDADGTVFSGPLTGNVGTVTIAGGQRVDWTSAANFNAFTGNVVISGAGTALRTNVGTIPDLSSVSISSGASWLLNGDEVINSLTGTGSIAHVTSARTLTVGYNNGSGVFGGVISGQINLNKIGTGTLELNSASTFTGTVAISNGILLISNSGALGINSNVLIGGDSAENRAPALSLTGGVTVNVNNLSTSGVGFSTNNGAIFNVSGNNVLNIAGAFIIQGGNGASTYTSASGLLTINANILSANTTGRTLTLRGAGNGELNASLQNGTTVDLPLIKLDAGTWVLGKNNTYTGVTTLTAGTLQIGKGGVGSTGTGALSVAAPGTLAGSGTVKAASATTAHSILGTVRPGDDAGTSMSSLTFEGAVTFGSAAQTFLQLGVPGTNDKLVGSATNAGTLNLDGTIKVDFSGYVPAWMDSWTLIDWAGVFNFGSFNTGTNLRTGADGVAEGDFNLPNLTAYNSEYLWDINFDSTTRTAIITVVPEPGRVMLSFVALAALMLRRKRRQTAPHRSPAL